MKNSSIRFQGAVIGVVLSVIVALVFAAAAPQFGYRFAIEQIPAATEEGAVITNVPLTATFVPFTQTVPPATFTPSPTVTPVCNQATVKEGGAGLYRQPDGSSASSSLNTGTALCLQAYLKNTHWVYVTAKRSDNGVNQGWIWAKYIEGFPKEDADFDVDWAATAGIKMWEGQLPTAVAPFVPSNTPSPTVEPVSNCISFRAKNGGANVYLTADANSTKVDGMNTGDEFCMQAHTGKWAFGTTLNSNMEPVQGWVYITLLTGFPSNAGEIAENWYMEYGVPAYDSQARPQPIAPPIPTAIPTLGS